MNSRRKMFNLEFGIWNWRAKQPASASRECHIQSAIRNRKSAIASAARGAGVSHFAFRSQVSDFRIQLSAFTLIEVLVASAILAFLLVVFLSVASFASQAWRGSQQKMEEFSTARIVMNRIRSDLESIVIRPDLPLFPSNAMGFMSAKRGMTTNTDARLLSYVAYGMDASNRLVLTNLPYTFSSGSPPFSTNFPVPLPANFGSDATNNVLANGVIGFQKSFLNKNGDWGTNFNSKYDTNSANATNPTVAVRVSLLLVSSEGLKHLQNTDNLSDVSGEMALSTSQTIDPNKSPEVYWNEKIQVGGNIDLPTARSLRAFERVFFLPN